MRSNTLVWLGVFGACSLLACGSDDDSPPVVLTEGGVGGSGGKVEGGVGGTGVGGASKGGSGGLGGAGNSGTGGASAGSGGSTPSGPVPPHHVIVAQGPTASQQLYALITWDRNNPAATAYKVVRDGQVLTTILVKDDPWDDTSYKDTAVTPGVHTYAVRALENDTEGGDSAAFTIRIRSDSDFGQVYAVDSAQGGDDSEKIKNAIAAAAAAGGGVVQFSARTYALSSGIVVTGDNIVLRGAGVDQTILQPTYAGYPGDDACSGTERIVLFDATQTDLATKLSAPIQPGDRVVPVTDTTGLAIGQIILLSETHAEQEPSEFQSQGVVMDPATGKDDRYPYETNEIVAVDATSVTFKYPFSYGFSTAVPWKLYSKGLHNGLELLTIQGRDENEQTWYDGVTFRGADLFAAEVKVQWTNRRIAQVGGHNVRLVGFQGPYGGPQGFVDGICRYKVQIYKATNALFVGSEMGRDSDDHNQSLITIQQTVRIVVRNSVFHKSRTYGVNEHGEGSRHLLVENNRFALGETCPYAVVLGNNTWGFSGPMILRNNTFENHQRDIRIDQNSYEVKVLDNISRGNTKQFLRAFGWAGPNTSADLYGSLRLTIARNQVLTGARGIYLGSDDSVSNIYPFAGVRDVVMTDNVLQVTEEALLIRGTGEETKRLQATGNTGSSNYDKPAPGAGDYWSGNADGQSFGQPTQVPWTAESFVWEEYDRN